MSEKLPERIFVKPRRFPLDDQGCIWEYSLFGLGWNNLPEEKRYGEVTNHYGDTLDEFRTRRWINVYFPALNHIETCSPACRGSQSSSGTSDDGITGTTDGGSRAVDNLN